MVQFILFPGFGMYKYTWSLDHNLKKINFLNELKKLGKVYAYTPLFYNINKYHKINSKHKMYKHQKLYGNNIKFDLDYLDVKKHCKMIYDKIREKTDDKIVVIGHSIGSLFCYHFSKMYKDECLFSVVIDGMLLGKQGIEDHKKYIKQYNKYKNTTDCDLYDFQTKIKKDRNDKDISELFNIVQVLLKNQIPDRITKFPIKTVYFKNLEMDDKDKKHIKLQIEEMENYEKNDNLFQGIYFVNKTHYLHYNKKCSDIIIEKIKCMLKN